MGNTGLCAVVSIADNPSTRAQPGSPRKAVHAGSRQRSYLWTLSQTIAEAERHADAAVRGQAAEARRMLDALTENIPWADSMGEPGFDTGWMQDVRRQAADAIVRLRSSMPPNR